MYTNIPTDRALLLIGTHLRNNDYGIPVEALMDALNITMKYNVFTFGDTTWLQIQGTAMGTPPAPLWAIMYYALCENDFLVKHDSELMIYRRFIDDIFRIWT